MVKERKDWEGSWKEYYENLFIEYYDDDPPEYIRRAGKTYMVWVVGDTLEKVKRIKITMDDVLYYFDRYHNDFQSSIRSLSGFLGDWRPVDSVAQECSSWFKYVAPAEYRRRARKRGMIPRF